MWCTVHSFRKSIVWTTRKNMEVPPRKLTWQWNIHQLRMYFLLKMVIFQCHKCHVSFQGCNGVTFTVGSGGNGDSNYSFAPKTPKKNVNDLNLGNPTQVFVPWILTCVNITNQKRVQQKSKKKKVILSPFSKAKDHEIQRYCMFSH